MPRRNRTDPTKWDQLLFVYGTLKRSFGNYRYIEDASFVGEAVSVERNYQMWEHGFPLLIEAEPGLPVRGELFWVTPKQLAACDRLEGHPSFYERKLRAFKCLQSETEAYAWVYLIQSMRQMRGAKKVSPIEGGHLKWE